MAEHKKRSLNANAYFWLLCEELAKKTGRDKKGIYRGLIRRIGDNCEVLPIKIENLERFRRVWEKQGIGWVCDVIEGSEYEEFISVTAYYGSSVYNTRQMSELISKIILLCEAAGIPTATPDEVANMLSLWAQEPKGVRTSV